MNVCSGASAKRYHKSENCRGLLNCGGIIEEMSVSEAENTMWDLLLNIVGAEKMLSLGMASLFGSCFLTSV